DFHVTGVQTCALPIYVVHAVAHQRQQVDDLVRPHAVLLHDGLVAVHAAAAHGVHQGDARAHQLHEVLVAGGDRDVQACLRTGHEIGRASCRESVEDWR